MKKHFSKIGLVIVLGLFIIPQVTHAAWWKPTTWFNSWTFSVSKVESVKTDVKAIDAKAVLRPVTVSSEQNTNKNIVWKTHVNTDIGFTFNYPPTWFVEDRLTTKTCCVDVSNNKFPYTEPVPADNIKIQIQYHTKSASKSLKEIATRPSEMGGVNTKGRSCYHCGFGSN